MRRNLRFHLLVAALASVALWVTGPAARATDQATQQVAGGGVTVTATLLKGKAEEPTIQIALNTHSVDLDAVNFQTIATLRDDRGKIYPVEAVESASGGGHHRQAVLRFGALPPPAKTIELVVKDVGGVKERTFRWELGS